MKVSATTWLTIPVFYLIHVAVAQGQNKPAPPFSYRADYKNDYPAFGKFYSPALNFYRAGPRNAKLVNPTIQYSFNTDPNWKYQLPRISKGKQALNIVLGTAASLYISSQQKVR